MRRRPKKPPAANATGNALSQSPAPRPSAATTASMPRTANAAADAKKAWPLPCLTLWPATAPRRQRAAIPAKAPEGDQADEPQDANEQPGPDNVVGPVVDRRLATRASEWIAPFPMLGRRPG